MKRWLMITVMLWVFIGSVAVAQEDIDIRFNDTLMTFDTRPVLVGHTPMVPLRAMTEIIGAELTWEPVGQFITIELEGAILYMRVGAPAYMMYGSNYAMDVAPMIIEGRTLVPADVVANNFGFNVTWNEEEMILYIQSEDTQLPEDYRAGMAYTEEDLLWLARIVNVEGLDIGYEAKLAIANVVLNRVKADIYPNSVYDVIMDTAYATQFPPAHRASFLALEPDEQSYEAARDALEGKNNIEDCLYFNNVPFQWKADDFFAVIDGEYFYR